MNAEPPTDPPDPATNEPNVHSGGITSNGAPPPPAAAIVTPPPAPVAQATELIMVPHVPVTLPPPDEPAISEDTALDSLQRLGLPHLSRQTIRDLSNLGLHLGGAGVIRLNRGDAFLSTRQADQAITLLLLEMTQCRTTKGRGRPSALTALAGAIATLLAAKTKAQSIALEIERTVRTPGSPAALSPIDEPPPKACFAANENIILTNEVHLHHSPKDAKP